MMLNVSQILLDGNFISNGYNSLWASNICRLQIASDFIIIISYFSISLILVHVLWQHPDIPFQKMSWLFCALIMAGGTSHLLEVWSLWHPDYGLSSLFNVIAAGVAFYMAREWVDSIHNTVALPNRLNLERANQALAEERTQELRQALAELKDVILQLQWEIGQRQQVEASLREREEQYRSVVDNVKEVIFQTDVHGYWTFLNPAWHEITDFAIADSLGTYFLDYVHPDDRQRHLDEFQVLIGCKKESCRQEVRYRTHSGSYRWLEVFIQLTLDANRTITGTCGTLHDITERHLGEAALAERERYLAALVEVQRRLLAFEKDTQQGFIQPKPYHEILEVLGQVANASRVYVFENHRDPGGRLLMSQKAEWCAPGIQPKRHSQWVQNLAYEDVFPRWSQVLSQNEIIAGTITEFPQSERVVLELQGIFSILVLPLTVNGLFFGFIGFDNCTEGHPWQASEIDLLTSAAAAVSLWNESFLAQQALRHSETVNRALLEAIPDALVRIRRDGTYLDFIPAKNSPTPISARAFLGKKIADLVPPELALKLSADVAVTLSTGKVHVSEVPLEIKGERRHYEIRSVFYSEDEVLMMGRDVTEQKQAEAALRESEERFRSLVAHIPGVVYRRAYDADWTIDFISDVIEEMIGYPAADFLHNQVRTFPSVIAPEDRARVERVVADCVALRKPYVIEYRLVRKDGTIRWVYEKGQGVFAADHSLLCLDGVLFDITERKLAEVEILNALAKEKELGDLKSRFISITSHEFRTPLATIMSTAELLEYYEWSREDKVEQLHLIQDAVKHMLQLLEDS
ncbi:MAG TPA: PAS domain S-box protein, partial [Stenomitos sp.]